MKIGLQKYGILLSEDFIYYRIFADFFWNKLIQQNEYEKTSPSSFYPRRRVTEEDRKNGYMTMYGLPVGTYTILIDETFYDFTPLVVKP